ncbi:MAG TPA: hypothetical protein DDX92_13400 [Flavobacteriales bacterium]|nr:hypothetical protein [Flavobacteriales bacterium]
MTKRNDIIVGTIITLFGILWYIDFDTKFTGLDDNLIFDNQWDKMKDYSYLVQAFRQNVFLIDGAAYYRPIQTILMMPIPLLTGTPNPYPDYYLYYGIFWMIITLLTILQFLKVLGFREKYRYLFVSLLTVHPAMVEAVCWSPGNVDLFLTTFTLWSLIFFIQWRRKGSFINVVFHLLFWNLALLTKEAALLFPALFVISSLLSEDFSAHQMFKKDGSASFSEILYTLPKNSFRWLWANKLLTVSWIISLLFWFILRSNTGSTDAFSPLIYIDQIPSGFEDVLFAIGSMLLPAIPVAMLEVSWVELLISLPGIILLFYWAWKNKTSTENFSIMIVWLFLTLITTTVSGYAMMHRMILPMIGLAFGFSFLNAWIEENPRRVIVYGSIVFIVWGGFNLHFQKDFGDPFDYWNSIITKSNSESLGYYGLGNSYVNAEDYEKAIKYSRKALALDSTIYFANIGLAVSYHEIGKYDSAVYYYRKEMEVQQEIYQDCIHFLLGRSLLKTGKKEEAIQQLRLGYNCGDQSRHILKIRKQLEDELGMSLNPGED